MAKLKKQHMTIHWKAIVQDDSSIPATEARSRKRATLVRKNRADDAFCRDRGMAGSQLDEQGFPLPGDHLYRRHWTACHLLHLH